jgi:thioesterase domain-containing protein
MGGLVAYEMAQQLAAEGARVDRVIVIDTVVPRVGGAATSDAQLTAALVRDMAATLGVPATVPRPVVTASMSEAERLTAVQRWLAGSAELSQSVSVDELKQRFAIFRPNQLAQRSYRPAPTAVPLTLVRPFVHSDRSDDWQELAGDLLTVQEFPGNHYSLLREPTVGQVAGWLRAHLTEVIAPPPRG